MSESAHSGALATPAGLSFRQWQVWTVLLFAGVSGYLSLAVHDIARNQDQLHELVNTTAQLRDGEVEHPGQWLVGVYEVLPEMETFAAGSVATLSSPLQDVTVALLRGEGVYAAEHRLLRQRLALVLTELQAVDSQMATALERHTHYFYISMGALLAAILALFLQRLQPQRFTVLQQLLQDQLLFTDAPVALSLSDRNDRLVRVNRAFEQMSGFTEAELLGLPMHHLDSHHADTGQSQVLAESDQRSEFVDDEGFDGYQQVLETLKVDGRWVGDFQLRCKDGSVVGEKVMRVALGRAQQPEGYLTMSMDPVISDDEKRLMLWQAHHDNLTKLPNSNLLHERLTRTLIANEKEGKLGALISIDIDNFQNVNDSLGHARADRVLTEAAYRIAMCARETDTVARMGGDLFVIALHEIQDVADAERMARAAVQAMRAPFLADGSELFIAASAGVVVIPDDGAEQGELLQKADAARMDAKGRGGNQMAFFEEKMNSLAARRLEIELHLRRAIANNEFELYYQPVMDISDETAYGAEALLRWHSEALGFVSPAEFIPVAEQSGLIVDIGQWVVQEVQQQLRRWEDQSKQQIRISLNVSARQFHQEEDAKALLSQLATEFCDRVTVEVTESALIDDSPGAQVFLDGIRALGVHIALDDFGTGFSSVGYLRDFEFDVLKIDKSFIDSICEVRDHGLVASIVAMGRILGMRVIAEGVEEEAQLSQLRQIGCDYVQGYFYAKPLPLAEFERFLQALEQQQVAG
ncbi:MAG: EAL domain-containing protein [Pseudomonadota bacterium]